MYTGVPDLDFSCPSSGQCLQAAIHQAGTSHRKLLNVYRHQTGTLHIRLLNVYTESHDMPSPLALLRICFECMHLTLDTCVMYQRTSTLLAD